MDHAQLGDLRFRAPRQLASSGGADTMIATSSPPPAKDGGLVSADLGTDLLGEKHSNVKRRLPEDGQGWPTPGAGIHKMHLISTSEAHRVFLSAVFRSR